MKGSGVGFSTLRSWWKKLVYWWSIEICYKKYNAWYIFLQFPLYTNFAITLEVREKSCFMSTVSYKNSGKKKENILLLLIFNHLKYKGFLVESEFFYLVSTALVKLYNKRYQGGIYARTAFPLTNPRSKSRLDLGCSLKSDFPTT